MKRLIPIFALLVVAIVAVGALAMPFGFFGKEGSQSAEQTAVQQALQAGDFAAWKVAVVAGVTAHVNKMTQDDFQKMVSKHQEREQKHVDMEAKMAPIKNALEAGDYNAWKLAVSSMDRKFPFADKITEENFLTFVQLHKAMKSGDREQVKQLSEQLGLKGPMGKEGFRGRGHFGGHGFGKQPVQ